MNKPVGRTVIRIKDYEIKTRVIEYDHIEIYEQSPLKGLARKYTPKAGDRIYIYPETNIPRFKLKRFCENYKVFIAKAKETANVFFMDPKTVNSKKEFYKINYSCVLIYKDYFINYLKKSTAVGDERYSKLLEDLAASSETIVYLKEHARFKNHGINGYTIDLVEEDDLYRDDDGKVDLSLVNCEMRDNVYSIEDDAQIKNFTFLEGKDFYHPDAMLALLNEGSVLDKEMYDGIINLFNSNDANDHKIAVEAMANCDYQKSAVYLLMTFYHNRNEIYNCDSKHHVNFKSFLSFFDLKAGQNISIDDIVDILKEKRLLNSSNLTIVMEEAKKVITERVEGSTAHFIFTEIVPTEEIQKEVEETDAEIAAELVVIPEPVIESIPVEPIPEPVIIPVIETPEPVNKGDLSHL